MEKDVLIVEENLMDNYEQEKASLEAILDSPEFNMDTIPEDLPKKAIIYKKCRCGNPLFESPKGQFRCGHCGNILYKKNLEGGV